MKKLFIITALLACFVFTLPVLSVRGEPLLYRSDLAALPPDDSGGAVEVGAFPTAAPGDDPILPRDAATDVAVLVGEEVRTMPLSDYLLGVVAAEMPASFPDEALKAQAIAARTFTLNRMILSSSAPFEEHNGAHVCANFAHCKAYTPPDELREKWGDDAEGYIDKIRSAVSATDGLVALYESEPILAVFHAASSGRTERAADVWERDVPYLQSVDSPGEEESPRYHGRAEVSADEFKAQFLAAHPDAALDGAPETWFSDIERSASGGVIRLSVGGVTVKGSAIRTMCNLLSTNFELECSGDAIVFKTIGYGHGVGMSQYGAKALALEGKTAEEIIKWYYTGVSIGYFSL